MARTVHQLQDLVQKLESELELSKFLNKGVLQTNLEYKARIADLEYENDVLRKAESRLAATEEDLEQAIARAEQLEERLIEEEGRTQAALKREAAALQRAAAAERPRPSLNGNMSFQDKLRKAEWEAEWEEVVRSLEREKADWQQRFEHLSTLLAPVITALNEQGGGSSDLTPRRPNTAAKSVSRSANVRAIEAWDVNGPLANENGRSAQHTLHYRSRPATSTSASTTRSRSTLQTHHSSPIRSKRKSGSDDDDDFRPQSTPDKLIKASRLGGQRSVHGGPQANGDDRSCDEGEVDVKSEPDSDCDPLAL